MLSKCSRLSRHIGLAGFGAHYTVSQKTVQTYFCQNFIKFPAIVKIFGTKMKDSKENKIFWGELIFHLI